jgi:hypothetical protein
MNETKKFLYVDKTVLANIFNNIFILWFRFHPTFENF